MLILEDFKMEWNTLLKMVTCCLDCPAVIVQGMEQLTAYFKNRIFFADEIMTGYQQLLENVVYHKVPGTTCCITECFHTYTCLMVLEKDSFLILGPYLTGKPTEEFTNCVSRENRLPLSMIPSLKHFYSQLPILPHIRIQSVTEVLKDYAGYLASGPFYIHSVEKSADIGETWLQIQENHLDTYQTMLEEKYQNDLNLCKALLAGDLDTCLRIQHVKNYRFIPLDPRKKDTFSHLIYDYSFNILYRIITYAAGVPALYIQELQDKWNHRINNRLVSFDHSFFGADMITSYCALVQRKSFRQHSIHIKKALAYISSHLSTSITIDNLASCLHVSKGHLSKVFKDEMGESIVSYINRERIYHALPMMQDSEMKIQDICLCVGIEDSNYFSRLFKKYMGISPVEYQKQTTGISSSRRFPEKLG